MSEVQAYNWNDLKKDSPRHGIERVAFRGDNALVVVNWIHPGMAPGPHSHPFEQLVFIVEGRTRMHVGDTVLECVPGSMVRVPPGVLHWAESVSGEVCVNVDVFSPVRADYLHLVAYQHHTTTLSEERT
jgi:quercetin dioxygenase-like cupin family protein